MFAIHFWSNQDPDETARASPDHSAFLPDASGKIDMTGYHYLEHPGFTNFDFGFWDETSGVDLAREPLRVGPGRPDEGLPEHDGHFAERFEVTPGEWRFGYPDFDREGWGVAQADNYDPTKASHPKLTSPRLVGDATIERVFRGKATLGPGSPKAAVRKIQQLLVEKGYDLGDFGPAKDGVDGKYGDKTVSGGQEVQDRREPRQPVERQHRPRRDPAARRAVPAVMPSTRACVTGVSRP